MEIKPSIVGAFVLIGLTIGVAVILLFGSTHFFSRTEHAVVYFRGSVANLGVGAPVTFRGVRVGSVTSIAVTLNMADLTARIPVCLDLNPTLISLQNNGAGQTDSSLANLLKAGLRAQLTMQSLITGQLYVELDLLPDTVATTLGDDLGRTEIPSIPTRLQTIEGEISALPFKEIAENANRALAAIQQMADALSPRIGPIADSFKQTSDAARVTLNDIDRLAIAGGVQLTAKGNDLSRVLASSDRSAKEAERVLISMEEMTAVNSPLRSDLQSATRDLAASASSLRAFTHDIERNPSVLLTGKTPR